MDNEGKLGDCSTAPKHELFSLESAVSISWQKQLMLKTFFALRMPLWKCWTTLVLYLKWALAGQTWWLCKQELSLLFGHKSRTEIFLMESKNFRKFMITKPKRGETYCTTKMFTEDVNLWEQIPLMFGKKVWKFHYRKKNETINQQTLLYHLNGI